MEAEAAARQGWDGMTRGCPVFTVRAMKTRRMRLPGSENGHSQRLVEMGHEDRFRDQLGFQELLQPPSVVLSTTLMEGSTGFLSSAY